MRKAEWIEQAEVLCDMKLFKRANIKTLKAELKFGYEAIGAIRMSQLLLSWKVEGWSYQHFHERLKTVMKGGK